MEKVSPPGRINTANSPKRVTRFYWIIAFAELSPLSIWSLTIAGSLELLKHRIIYDRRRSPDRWKVFPYDRRQSLAVLSAIRRSWAIIWKLGLTLNSLSCVFSTFWLIMFNNTFSRCSLVKSFTEHMTAGELPLEITSNRRISIFTDNYKMEEGLFPRSGTLFNVLVISTILTV